MHFCIPDSWYLMLAYLFFFFLAFFAILFSSRSIEDSRQQSWRSAFSISMYSDGVLACQEKSERKKLEGRSAARAEGR
jgi:hypothetical protein